MRWFWIDRYTEFVSGERATAIKNISLAEEHLHDHFSGYTVMPNTLVLEGMAQTAGLLFNEVTDFEERVVLAKLSRINFHFHPMPGDTLTYRAELHNVSSDGALASVTSHLGDRPQAEADMFFAQLAKGDGGPPLFEPYDLLNWLNNLRVFDVGVKPDGSRIEPPAKLQASLQAVLAQWPSAADASAEEPAPRDSC